MMKLNLQQIKAITLGATRVEEDQNGYNFYRFTEKQMEIYKPRRETFYRNTFSTSGVCLAFNTNSKSLYLSASVLKSSSQNYFSFDLFVNGEMVDSLNNFENVQFDKSYGYNHMGFPFGDFEKNFSLCDGEKEVRIYLPWSATAIIKEISLDDGIFLKPVKSKYKMLAFGDSITQGYHSLYPSSKYVTRLANFLDAEEYNKAIGGEIHFPELAKEKDNFTPDFITVAYGTNDWSKCGYDETKDNCTAFYENLCKSYPDTKIFTITPIWRKDEAEERPFGKFKSVTELIKEVTANFQNVTVITGYDFIPHEEKYFADRRLHPNDEGFLRYFKSLSEQIRL